MFNFIVIVVPLICYTFGIAVMVYKGEYGDAMMFGGYAFANAGIFYRIHFG